jgi:hypothetical protein
LQRTCTAPVDLLENGGQIVIDGVANDWRLTPGGGPQPLDDSNTYFIARMYEAGNPTKNLLSRAYGSFVCATKTLYILVHVEGTAATSILTDMTDLWLKIYDVDNSVVPPTAFQIVYESGQPKGWEASYDLSSGTYSVLLDDCFEDVEIHANVPPGSTSSTGKRNVLPSDPIALEIKCSTAPAPIPAPIPAPVPTSTAAPVPALTAAPVPTSTAAPVPALTAAPAPVTPPDMQPCEGYCNGEYPYGCADRLDWPYKFMCAPNRVCYYSYTANDPGPYDE